MAKKKFKVAHAYIVWHYQVVEVDVEDGMDDDEAAEIASERAPSFTLSAQGSGWGKEWSAELRDGVCAAEVTRAGELEPLVSWSEWPSNK